MTPNQDGAGVVDSVGEGVVNFAVGDRVWVYLAGHQRLTGTAQEYTNLPAARVVRLPTAASFDIGASLGVPAMTAHRALTVSEDGPKRLHPGALSGKVVLVAGGAGAVGHAAIQLARWAGATVITTISGPAKAALATAAGAHHPWSARTRPARGAECRFRFEAMRVAIAGGHGQIALRLAKVLSRRGDEAVALIRNPDQADEVRQAGAEPAVVDLEHASEDEVAQAIAGSDAVVFAAGAGPGSGPRRKETMDYGGAVKLIAAAKQAGVDRYVIVSSMGANPDAPGEDTFSVYLRAKGRADEAVQASGLDATIVRPGGLTNDAGTGRVSLGESVRRGHVTRDDVAAVLAAVLDSPNTIGRTVDLIGGDTPIAEAVSAI